MSDLTIWEKRWKTLDRVLAAMIHRYKTLSQKPTPPRRLETLWWLTEALRAFAHSQFHFYYEGFGDSPHLKLEPFEEMPMEYVFKTTLEQVAFDIEVIQKAAEQRLNPLPIEQRQKTLADLLNQADQLAQIALQPAIEAGLIEDTTVITYLQKSPFIRVIPYAPVALIGVPYSAAENPRDFLATPHEVGHHIYRHGKYVRSNLQRVPPQPDWRRRWLEEIFADAYGALIAGPVAGLSFQDLQLTKTLDDFTEDDGEHPVAFLRSDVYTRVLSKMGFQFSQSVKELSERWQRACVMRGRPESFVPLEDPGEVVGQEEAIALIDEAVDEVFELLKELPVKGGNSYRLPWSQDLEEDSSLDGEFSYANRQYAAFETFIETQTIQVPELKGFGESEIEIGVTRDGTKPAVTRPLGSTKGTMRWVEELKQMRGEGLIMPPALWGAVLSSDGWNVGGPDDPWPPS